MASIKLTADDFNSIVKACKPFISNKPARADLGLIHLNCDGHTCRALAIDGYKALEMSVGALPDSEECYIVIPVLKPVKAKETPFVTISAERNDVTFITANTAQTIRLDTMPTPDFAQSIRKNVFATTDPITSFYFSPKLLAETFGALDTACVRIDYFGEKKPLEIVGYTDNLAYHAIALPMRCTDKRLGRGEDE